MWSRSFLLLGLLVLSGCGFRPLYAPDAPCDAASAVRVDTIAEREGQLLRRGLLALFEPHGPCAHPLYNLVTTVEIQKSEFGLRRDNTAQRNRMTATVNYQLLDIKTKAPVYRAKKTAITSYAIGSSATTSVLPLIVSEKDAKARLMEELALAIHTDVLVYLQDLKSKEPTQAPSAP